MIKLAAFLVSLAVWCAFTLFPVLWERFQGNGDPNALAILIAVSAIYGVPVLVYAAIADALATSLFGRFPTLGFLSLALVGILGFLAFIQLGGGAPENKRAAMDLILPTFGPPTLTVIAVYMIANMLRSRRRRVYSNG